MKPDRAVGTRQSPGIGDPAGEGAATDQDRISGSRKDLAGAVDGDATTSGARMMPLSMIAPVIVLPVISTAVFVPAPLPALIVPLLETLPVNDVSVTVMQVSAAELAKPPVTAVQLPATAGSATPIRSAVTELVARRL